MPSPVIQQEQLARLEQALLAIPGRPAISQKPPTLVRGTQVLPVRQAMLAPACTLPVEDCLGKILADPCVGCPPAVPILICGQRIDERAIAAFNYYGITQLSVVE